MGMLLLCAVVSVAVAPAGLALAGIGVAPQQGALFAITQLVAAGIAIGLAYQNRYGLWMLAAPQFARRVVGVSALSGILLVAYLIAYNLTVVEHPTWGRVLFPFWLSGKAADMIKAAGSRYAAVDTYGLAAVFDAISAMPGTAYAITIACLLLLYALPLGAIGGVAATLVLRRPTPLFRPSASPGETFDVFLCYNRADALAVRAVARELALRQVRFFLDVKDNRPGEPWTRNVETVIRSAPAFAVFFGPAGVGNWQGVEIQNIMEERMTRNCSVVPVLLPDVADGFRLPMQLAGLTWVDFRRKDPDPVPELLRGIGREQAKPAAGAA
jgi:hypothetical protein